MISYDISLFCANNNKKKIKMKWESTLPFIVRLGWHGINVSREHTRVGLTSSKKKITSDRYTAIFNADDLRSGIRTAVGVFPNGSRTGVRVIFKRDWDGTEFLKL